MTAPARFDVAVIGAGAAGVAAALEAARLGASVALIEAQQPGGSCVHHTCIPTSILLDAAEGFARARELGLAGVLAAGETFQLGRANDRARALVRSLAAGTQTALRRAGVQLIAGHASFLEPSLLAVAGGEPVRADAVVIAAGARWEPLRIPGLPADRLATPDLVQTWREPPPSCLVLGGGPSGGLFAVEYAVLLALAGSAVTLAAPGPAVCAGFDDDLQPVIADLLGGLGIAVHRDAAPSAAEGAAVRLAAPGGEVEVDAAVVLAADPRVPAAEGLALERAGLAAAPDGTIPVDESAAAGAPGVFAAGDVTGRGMLSSTAAAMGRAAGAGAAGDPRRCRLEAVPRLVHALPPLAAVGCTAAEARARGAALATATVAMEGSAWSAVRGGQPGFVRLHADARTGEILGVQAAGPGAHELVGAAAALMQAEATAGQLAAALAWHPSPLELLAEAARRL